VSPGSRVERATPPFAKPCACVAIVGSILVGCSTVITAPNLSDGAHVIASTTGVAYADLNACIRADAGTIDCSAVTTDLCAILDKATEFENIARDAGFTPVTPIQTISSCAKK
jgi:hypothetical protein